VNYDGYRVIYNGYFVIYDGYFGIYNGYLMIDNSYLEIYNGHFVINHKIAIHCKNTDKRAMFNIQAGVSKGSANI